jgi:hypothetical protein
MPYVCNAKRRLLAIYCGVAQRLRLFGVCVVVRFRRGALSMRISWLFSLDLMRFLDQDDMERVAVVARAVWFRRNAVVHGRQIGPPHLVVSQTLENLEAFQQANTRQRSPGGGEPPTTIDGKLLRRALSRSIGTRQWIRFIAEWVLESLYGILMGRWWPRCLPLKATLSPLILPKLSQHSRRSPSVRRPVF